MDSKNSPRKKKTTLTGARVDQRSSKSSVRHVTRIRSRESVYVCRSRPYWYCVLNMAVPNERKKCQESWPLGVTKYHKPWQFIPNHNRWYVTFRDVYNRNDTDVSAFPVDSRSSSAIPRLSSQLACLAWSGMPHMCPYRRWISSLGGDEVQSGFCVYRSDMILCFEEVRHSFVRNREYESFWQNLEKCHDHCFLLHILTWKIKIPDQY